MINIRETLACLYNETKSIHKYALLTIFAGILTVTASKTILPLVTAKFFEALSTGNTSSIWMIFGSIGALLLFADFWDRVFDFGIIKYETKGYQLLRNLATKSILEKPVTYFSKNYIGTLVARVKRFSSSFEAIFDQIGFVVISTSLQIITISVVLWNILPILGAGFVFWFSLFAYASYRFKSYLTTANTIEAQLESKFTGTLADTLTLATTYISFSATDVANERVKLANEAHAKALYEAWKRANIQRAIMSLCTKALLMGAIAGAIYLWQLGQITGTTVITVYLYISSVIWLFNDLARHFTKFMKSISDANEMIEILRIPKENDIESSSCEFNMTEGEIQVKDVSVSYSPGAKPTLKKVTVNIPSRKKIGIVGQTGSGKSTLIRTILQHLNPCEGEIYFDGVSAHSISKSRLRRFIAEVPQEVVLSSGTIASNIAFIDQQIDMGKVVEMAKKAHIHEFIMGLPDQYNTEVGERGKNLSGGERQRIGIARALYANPKILILDEATASLDATTEESIRETIANIDDITLVVIAHRLATVRDCDEILVFENGTIVERGTHKSLIALSGTYSELVKNQLSI